MATGSVATAGPLESLEHSVHEVRLPNGAIFLLLNQGAAPTVSTVLRFAVGGVEEDPGASGLAHFFEHLAFKGSPKVTATELWRAYQRSGGLHLNANTSKDLTTYVVSLPSNRIELWAWIDSDRVFHPTFQEFDSERKVVIEERRQRIDNRPNGRLWEVFMEAAFGHDTPYAIPTIGSIPDLERLTVEQASRFHQKFYCPDRLTGTLVGRFDVPEAEAIIRKYFSSVTTKAPPILKPGLFVPQHEPKKTTIEGNGGPSVLIGYHKPTLPNRDDYVFDMISELLGGGRTSRLYQALVRNGKAISMDVDNSVPGTRLHNLMVISIDPNKGTSPDLVQKIIDQEIARLQTEPATPEELQVVRKRLYSNILWSLEDNDSLASLLGYYQAVAGDWRYLTRYLDVIAAIGPQEIQAVAKKYLTPENRTIAVLLRKK